MRLNRRALLGGLASAPFAAPQAQAQALEPARIEFALSTRPIPAFEPRNPGKTAFGRLVWRGGLQLSGDHPRFGGFSGLWLSPDGGRLVAISDRAFWLTARIERRDGRLIGLSEPLLAPILGNSGRPLHRSRYYDTESLSIVDGIAHIGVERTHDILRFDFGRHGVEARARIVPVPPQMKRLPRNRGIEALGLLTTGPVAGALLAIAERSGDEDEPTVGFLIGGRQPGRLSVRRHDGFDITDLAVLPDGDIVLLERWYRPLRGVGCRVRRIAARTIRPGAMLDGEYLFDADLGQEIDNMEGIAVHRDQGRTILTLISDDNFSFIQRTLLLEFELAL